MFEVDQTVYETPTREQVRSQRKSSQVEKFIKGKFDPQEVLPPGTPYFLKTKPPPLELPPAPPKASPKKEPKLRGESHSGRDMRKKSVYLPDDILAEVEAEAKRQDRSVSWLIQKAWQVAAPTITKFPGA